MPSQGGFGVTLQRKASQPGVRIALPSACSHRAARFLTRATIPSAVNICRSRRIQTGWTSKLSATSPTLRRSPPDAVFVSCRVCAACMARAAGGKSRTSRGFAFGMVGFDSPNCIGMKHVASAKKEFKRKSTSSESRKAGSTGDHFAVCVDNDGYEASLNRNKI